MEEVRYDTAFLFRWSPRRGTKAARFEDRVPDEVAQERLERVIALQREHTEATLARRVGRVVEVLVTGPAGKGEGRVQGRSARFESVVLDGEASLEGALVPVRVTASTGKTLLGRLEPRGAAAPPLLAIGRSR
jgi:tRNA-2-methylthio-N6-dimethylallyladenosine synthase